MIIYFGFAISDSMFSGDVYVTREVITAYDVERLLPHAVPCLNPSHTATIEAAKSRFGFAVEIPKHPPKVSLCEGDILVVMQVQGLPRLTDRHEYTEAEIAKASFTFAKWTVARGLAEQSWAGAEEARVLGPVDRG